MTKEANPNYPIHELIQKRWSPYGFSEKEVSSEDLRSLFEAARWAASSYNEQPWVFIVATKAHPEQYQKLLSCLVEPNQKWAQKAFTLVLGIVRHKFSHNNKQNNCALHDLGLASANISLEATKRGLSMHQMAGILPDKARELYKIPEDASASTAFAIGYAASLEELDTDLKDRDTTPRTRKPLEEFVFGNNWGEKADLF